MQTILLLGAILVAGGLVGILLKIAVACVVIWAIRALLQWAGVVIPRPVEIILVALIAIILLVWTFELFGALL